MHSQLSGASDPNPEQAIPFLEQIAVLENAGLKLATQEKSLGFVGVRDAQLDEVLEKLMIYDHRNRVAYLPIPKNASTFMKSAMVKGSAKWDDFQGARGNSIHRFIYNPENGMRRENQQEAVADYFKVAVIRNPWGRIVSGYFDKFVKPGNSGTGSRTALEISGSSTETNSITFRAFVEYLCRTADDKLDRHFRSQSAAFMNRLGDFNLIGQFENLNIFKRALSCKLGVSLDYEAGNIRKSAVPLRTTYAVLPQREREFVDLTPQEFRAAISEGCDLILPKPHQMVTPEIWQAVQLRFAEDFELYRQQFSQAANYDNS